MALFSEPSETIDPTVEAAKRAFELKNADRAGSRRLGWSAIGKECTRAGWMGFRWTSPMVIPFQGLAAINDGHRGEPVVADMLRGVDGVELWTEDPETPGEQITFEMIDGHVVGKLDGVIIGIIQAPKTSHVWECKICNEKKFNKLKALIEKLGEKNALEEWDPVYFAQAQGYMGGMGLKRHYMNVATPGVRDIIGLRTEYQPEKFMRLEAKARTIVYDNRAPGRISNDPAFFGCKFCDQQDVCHGTTLPQVNCRTCTHASAVPGGKWHCNQWGVELSFEDQKLGCKSHRYHPDLVNGTPLDVNDNGDVQYKMRVGGHIEVDGIKPSQPDRPASPVVTFVCPVCSSPGATDDGCDICASGPNG